MRNGAGFASMTCRGTTAKSVVVRLTANMADSDICVSHAQVRGYAATSGYGIDVKNVGAALSVAMMLCGPIVNNVVGGKYASMPSRKVVALNVGVGRCASTAHRGTNAFDAKVAEYVPMNVSGTTVQSVQATEFAHTGGNDTRAENVVVVVGACMAM